MSKFRSNEGLLQYFLEHPLLEQVIFKYILYLIYFLLLPTVLFTLRVSSLLSPLSDASVDFVDNEVSFQFFPEAEFIPLHTFTSPLQQTLKQNHRASHNCCSIKYLLRLLAFKWLLNDLLLETEWSEVMLLW